MNWEKNAIYNFISNGLLMLSESKLEFHFCHRRRLVLFSTETNYELLLESNMRHLCLYFTKIKEEE